MAKEINIKLLKAKELIESDDDMTYDFIEYLKEYGYDLDTTMEYSDIFLTEIYGYLNNQHYYWKNRKWLKKEVI